MVSRRFQSPANQLVLFLELSIFCALVLFIVIAKSSIVPMSFHADTRPLIERPALQNFIPKNAYFMASTRGTYFYPVLSTRGQQLSPKYRVYFETQEQAVKAGFIHWK